MRCIPVSNFWPKACEKLSAKLIICGILSIHFWVLPLTKYMSAHICVCVCINVCIYVCRVDLSTSLHKIPQSEAELQTAGRWVVGSTGYHNKAYNTLHYTNANTIEGYLCVCVCVCTCCCSLCVVCARLCFNYAICLDAWVDLA